jgi:hypothetical protein
MSSGTGSPDLAIKKKGSSALLLPFRTIVLYGIGLVKIHRYTPLFKGNLISGNIRPINGQFKSISGKSV